MKTLIKNIKQLVQVRDQNITKLKGKQMSYLPTLSNAWLLINEDKIENFGGRVLVGTCFYQQYAREIGEANGWTRLLSNSAKIVNILGGYGYQPALGTMQACIASAEKGVILS
mgnify:CR=1 FL=1